MTWYRSPPRLALALALSLTTASAANCASAQSVPLDPADLELFGVIAETVSYDGRSALRMTEGGGANDAAGLAIIDGTDFADGTIEVDVAGQPGPGAPPGARGFIGVAFRVQGDSPKFECFYLRPTNGRADDQLRRNHSTQYISHPDYPWERLRNENPGRYESYVDLVPGAWTNVRIVVSGLEARLFVNGSDQPCLIVNDLKLGDTRGAVGLWIGLGTVAHFSRLQITSPPAPSLDQKTRDALDEVVKTYIGKHGIPGLSASVARHGSVIWSQGYGMADVENRVPAQAETAYRSASIGKCITATAAMRLVEQHKLDLDRPIQDYCEAFPRKPWVITARHLLSHTAGIRHYGGTHDREEQTSTVHYASVADALTPFKEDPLLFEPGTASSYSTYGYDVLGCVLEGAAQMQFMDVIRRSVFEPCAMADSRDDDPSVIIPHRAAGYVRVAGQLRNATSVDMSNRLPAGGYLTTAPDLARFAAKFIDCQLVSRDTRDAMLKEQKLRSGDTVNYGLGWAIVEDATGHPDGTAFHGGSSPGASGMLYIDPQERLGVVILSNLEDAPERLETVRALARIVAEGGHDH